MSAAVHVDDYPTGPLDFQDDAALRSDPYLRDAAGRFAAHAADRPVRIKRGDPVYDPTGVTAISYEGPGTYTPVRPRPGWRRGGAR